MNGGNDLDISQALCDQIAQRVTGIEDGETLGFFVRRVLVAWQEFQDGDPVGTVRLSPDGVMAHRVAVDGLPMWRCSSPDGSQYNDLQPSLPWPVIG